jgi:serine/threonine-protein kinase RsbW
MRKKLGRTTNLVHSAAPPVPAGTLLFDQTFSSSHESKNASLDTLLSALISAGLLANEGDDSRARLCLDEALINAVMHGNRYDTRKRVRVRAYLCPADWTVIVEDEGPGFKEEDLPDPVAPENMLEESGRGVHLIRSMMDTVSYWKNGSALVMSQKISGKAAR